MNIIELARAIQKKASTSRRKSALQTAFKKSILCANFSGRKQDQAKYRQFR